MPVSVPLAFVDLHSCSSKVLLKKQSRLTDEVGLNEKKRQPTTKQRSFVVLIVLGYENTAALSPALVLAEPGTTEHASRATVHIDSAFFTFVRVEICEIESATLATVGVAVAFLAVRFRPRLFRNTKVAAAAFDESVVGMSAERASVHDRWIPLPGLDALSKNEGLGSKVFVEPRQADFRLLLNNSAAHG